MLGLTKFWSYQANLSKPKKTSTLSTAPRVARTTYSRFISERIRSLIKVSLMLPNIMNFLPHTYMLLLVWQSFGVFFYFQTQKSKKIMLAVNVLFKRVIECRGSGLP